MGCSGFSVPGPPKGPLVEPVWSIIVCVQGILEGSCGMGFVPLGFRVSGFCDLGFRFRVVCRGVSFWASEDLRACVYSYVQQAVAKHMN